MIIFDLETLADDSHRRHFVDASKNTDVEWWTNPEHASGDPHKGNWTKNGLPWKPDWQAYHKACEKDEPIQPVIGFLEALIESFCKDTIYPENEMQIWSTRCESTMEKTLDWLYSNVSGMENFDDNNFLKLRSVGDDRPGHVIKEEWLREIVLESDEFHEYNIVSGDGTKPIEFVFASDPESIAMYRKYGIFVFDCRQN